MGVPVIQASWDIVAEFQGMGMKVKLQVSKAHSVGMLQVGHCFFPVNLIGLNKMSTGSNYGTAEVRLDGSSGGKIATWSPYSKSIEIDFSEAARCFEVDKRFSPNVPYQGLQTPVMGGKALTTRTLWTSSRAMRR